MKKVFQYLFLTIIIFASGFLRVYRLENSPVSVNWDEAALGYNAYSLLKTGADEYGRKLPLTLRSFDDYKPAVYAYLVVPILTVFKLSDTTVRLPSAFLGLIFPLILFVLVAKLSRNSSIALLSAMLLALEPWSVHFSRIAYEANIANVLMYLGLTLLISKWLKNKTSWLGIIVLIVSTYTYHSERAIILPLLVFLYFIFKPKINKLSILIIPLFFIPLFVNNIYEPVFSRVSSTTIFKLWPFTPSEFSKIIFNPIYTFVWHLCGQFMAYFSPANLFVRGSQEPGQYIPTMGLFYFIEFPFWVWGLLKVRKYSLMAKFITPILLLSPLPAVVTLNWFSVIRTLPLYPIFTICTALGIYSLSKYKLHTVAILILIVSTVYLTNTEILYSPYITNGEYQPGFEKSIPYLLSLSENYDKVIIDSPHIAPYIFLLFYSSYDPSVYHEQVPKRIKNTGTESLPFGKYEFRKIEWISDKNLHKTLFMGPTVRLPDYEFEGENSTKILANVYDLHGYIAFRIVGNQ